MSVLLSNGDGTFAASLDYGAEFLPTSIAAADMNGDGTNDIVVADSLVNRVSVMLNACVP